VPQEVPVGVLDDSSGKRPVVSHARGSQQGNLSN
jgi:hypothetical protein